MQRFSRFENYCPLYEHGKGVIRNSSCRLKYNCNRVSEFIVTYQYCKATSFRKLAGQNAAITYQNSLRIIIYCVIRMQGNNSNPLREVTTTVVEEDT